MVSAKALEQAEKNLEQAEKTLQTQAETKLELEHVKGHQIGFQQGLGQVRPG